MRISDWSSDVCSSDLVDPNFVQSVFALPWGGTSLPIYFERDARVRSCSSYVAFYDNDVMKMVHALGQKWEAEYQHLQKEEQDAVLESMASPQGLCARQRFRSEKRRVGNEGVSTFRSRW